MPMPTPFTTTPDTLPVMVFVLSRPLASTDETFHLSVPVMRHVEAVSLSVLFVYGPSSAVSAGSTAMT